MAQGLWIYASVQPPVGDCAFWVDDPDEMEPAGGRLLVRKMTLLRPNPNGPGYLLMSLPHWHGKEGAVTLRRSSVVLAREAPADLIGELTKKWSPIQVVGADKLPPPPPDGRKH